MGKVKILTPVHIGSGKEYYIATIKDNYIYTLDNILEIAIENKINMNNVYDVLMNKKQLNSNVSLNLSREEFVRLFNVKYEYLQPKYSLRKITSDREKNLKGNVSEAMKDNDTLLIPGSSLKGYVLNVCYFDIIQNNKKVSDYFEKKFRNIYNDLYNQLDESDRLKIHKEATRKVNSVWNKVTKEPTKIMHIIGFRDILFDSDISYYEVERYDDEKTSLPQNVFETIPVDKEYSGEIYFTKSDLSIDHFNKLLNEAKKSINDDKNSGFEEKEIQLEIVEEIAKRMKNFKSWFVEANRKFMSCVIKEELEYVNKTYNTKVDTINLRNILQKLQQLNETKTIIQIGKSTNYIVKTVSIAFTDIYKKYFSIIFSPATANEKMIKAKPGIAMMPIAKVSSKGIYPLGFIEIEL